MKKKNDNFVYKEPSTLVLFTETYNATIGRIMEIIECLNLPEKQESAIKTQIKKEFYYVRDELAFRMTDEQFSSIFKLKLDTSKLNEIE